MWRVFLDRITYNRHKSNFLNSCNELDMNEHSFVEKLKDLGPLKITNKIIFDLVKWTKTTECKKAGHWKALQDCLVCIYGILPSKAKKRLPQILTSDLTNKLKVRTSK